MKYFLLLLLACFIWGAGFAATRLTLIDYSPIWSNSLRFFFAGLISIPYLLFYGKIKNHKAPIICGIFLLIALQLQTIGLKYTTLAKSGFLTTFYAFFTPLFVYLIYKTKLKLGYLLLLSISIIGIALICKLDLNNFNKGDYYTLVSAIFFSCHILAVDHYGQKEESIDFNLAQCFYIGLLGTALGLVFEGPPDFSFILQSTRPFFESSLFGFIILAVFSSIIAFSIQVYAQKGLPPHIVSLTFLSEAVFSAIFGGLFFKETLGNLEIIGAVIILSCVALIPRVCTIEKIYS